MGCKISTKQRGPNSVFEQDGPLRKQRTELSTKSPTTQENLHTSDELPPSRKDLKRLSYFKVSHTDLVNEKTGDINLEYTLLLPPVGRGAFGEVRRAIHKKTNLVRAVKIILKETIDEKERVQLINEVKILRSLDHPNIMKVFEFFQDEKAFYIVSELYSGGELFDKIVELKTFSEKMAAMTIKQILSAVYYCHQHRIVHRDLKPENMLYENKSQDSLLKIIDFGTSRVFNSKKKMNQKFGTPYYIAPEVLMKNYDEKCDIWSCGVILYIILCGYPPFNGPSDKKILEQVMIGRYEFEGDEWSVVSDEAKEFVSRLMQYDPMQRYSAEEALADPWLTKQADNFQLDKPLAMKALTNLQGFKAERKLQEAVWIFLVNSLATKDEKRELLKTFQVLDKNGDGQLTRDELIEGYKELMNIEDPEAEVEAIMNSVDYNNSGTIDYTEFVIATINRKNLLSKNRLDSAFKMFDKDGNGYLTADELKEVFGSKVDEEVWNEVIEECDENADGKISYEEFKDMMLKFIQ